MEALINEIATLLRTRRTTSGWTVHELAATLGISQARVHRALEELRELGYRFSAGRHDIIHIESFPDRMIDTEIHAGLKTRVFARQLYCYRRIGSTNTRAFELAEADAPEGTVVVAEEQTGGRGRLGRNWHSAPGLGIWASVILRPHVTLQKASGVSLLAALACAQAAEAELGVKIDLKWPNDGLIDGRKVFGLLTEVSAEVDRVYFVICGMGINVSHSPSDFPASLRSSATSLAIVAGHPVDRIGFFRRVLTNFEALYRGFRRDGLAPFLDDYRRRSVLIGREITITQGEQTLHGRAIGIDESGALVVRKGNRSMVILAGEATLRQQ